MDDFLVPLVLILGGLAGLVAGGEFLVRGASGLAAAARISPLVIGLTVVAFGTSSPELAVSIRAAFAGQADIAVGNVVGSNVFNVLFILGLSALVAPLIVSSQLIRLDVPLMIAACIGMLVLGLDGRIGRLDGLFLFTALVLYTGWSVVKSRKEQAAVVQEFEREFGGPGPAATGKLLLEVGLVVGGFVLLAVGANGLVSGAVAIARHLGMSELLIGLTIVAAGTSLPEVAASVMASLRGERDIAVGNVVGSNLFNILCVLGLSAAVAPAGVAVSRSALVFDIPIMIAVAVACLPIFFTGHLIARWEGALFFGYYWAYTAYLIFAATNPAVSRHIAVIMGVFVIPLTLLTVAIGVWRTWRIHAMPRR